MFWNHLRKESFHQGNYAKLHSKVDDSFKFLLRICNYNVSILLSVVDLSLYQRGNNFDSRKSLFQSRITDTGVSLITNNLKK